MSGKAFAALLFGILMSAVTADESTETWPPPTRSPKGNLFGKMVTLTTDGVYRGGITFYPPYYSPPPNDTVNGTHHPTRYPSWTTPPPTAGVTVCLRFVKDYAGGSSIFQLDPGYQQSFTVRYRGPEYLLSVDRINVLLNPNLEIWTNIYPEIWTRVCLVVDSMKKVVQAFSGSYMSARKLVNSPITWSGRPVIDFSSFDGQVTDIQIWDYPISSNMIYSYMSRSGMSFGNALTWSNIGYTIKGPMLMEDSDLYRMEAEKGEREIRLCHKRKKMFVNEKGGRMRNQM